MRLKATLYGTQKLFCEQRPNIVTCHYFWNSSFFRFRDDLDGVVISRSDQAQLNLNDHSPRFHTFITSRLAAGFGEPIYHPQQFLDDDDFMHHDSTVPRSSENEIVADLRVKYGIENIQTINLERHSEMMRIQNNAKPIELIPMPSALLACRLRSRLGCQKQVGIGHRGR